MLEQRLAARTQLNHCESPLFAQFTESAASSAPSYRSIHRQFGHRSTQFDHRGICEPALRSSANTIGKQHRRLPLSSCSTPQMKRWTRTKKLNQEFWRFVHISNPIFESNFSNLIFALDSSDLFSLCSTGSLAAYCFRSLVSYHPSDYHPFNYHSFDHPRIIILLIVCSFEFF